MTETNKEPCNNIIAKRRAALYNIKAQNTGFDDFFGRNIKKEKEMEIERQKLELGLMKKSTLQNIDKLLVKPGSNETKKRKF